MEQRQYVGLDVSQATTSICVINEAGTMLWRGKTSSEPDAIVVAIHAHAPNAARVGLEKRPSAELRSILEPRAKDEPGLYFRLEGRRGAGH